MHCERASSRHKIANLNTAAKGTVRKQVRCPISSSWLQEPGPLDSKWNTDVEVNEQEIRYHHAMLTVPDAGREAP